MQMSNNWVAFYSQSGSEIRALIEKGHIPNVIVTDSFESYLKNEPFFKEYNIRQEIRTLNVTKQDKIIMYDELLTGSYIVTLHGWMNIVPADVCERYNIYNGHPGHIVMYPELKGKDPQERAFSDIDKYEFVGCVIHEVTAGIDEGSVVVVAEQRIKNLIKIAALNGMYIVCNKLSLVTWETFFRNLHIIIEKDLNYDGTVKSYRKNIPIYC